MSLWDIYKTKKLGMDSEALFNTLLGNKLKVTYEQITESVPYLFRKTAGGENVAPECKDKIVGVSIAWNQLVNTSDTSVTLPNGRKYYAKINGAESIGISNGTAISVNGATDNVIDLTLLFGFDTTIADYIYNLEQATAGAGVSWLRKHGLVTKPYYAYDAGTFKHVSGLVSHDTVGFNQWDEEWEIGGIIWSTGLPHSSDDRIRSKNFNRCLPNTEYYLTETIDGQTSTVCFYDAEYNAILKYGSCSYGNKLVVSPHNAHYFKIVIVGTSTYSQKVCFNISGDGARNGKYKPYKLQSYPLDSDVVLRGFLRLDADKRLYADGDIYPPSGEVQRKYGIVDLGTLTWTAWGDCFYTVSITDKAPGSKIMCSRYERKDVVGTSNDKAIAGNSVNATTYIRDTAYSDAAAFKAAMSGVMAVYEKATPGTAQADPFTSPQTVDKNGTERYVFDDSAFAVPVGHETEYMKIV